MAEKTKTKYEELEEKKAEKLLEKEALKKKLQEIPNKKKQAIAEGKGISELIKEGSEINSEIEAITIELDILKELQEEVEIDHYKQKIAELQADKEEIWQVYKQKRDAFDKAKEEFERLEKNFKFDLWDWSNKNREFGEKMSHLENRIRDLEYFKETGNYLYDNSYQRKMLLGIE